MIDKNTKDACLDLLALADGRLDDDPYHKAQVEHAVARSPEMAEQLRDYHNQAEALRHAYDPCLAEPIPERLSAALESGKPRRRPSSARAVAAAILVIAACSAGWTAARLSKPGSENWMAQAIDLTGQASIQTSDHAIKAAAGARTAGTRLPDWLVEEASPHMKSPDLSSLGFNLIGLGKIETAAGRVLRLDYQTSDGRVINLFLRHRWRQQETSIQMKEENGVTITSWMEGPLATAVAGPISRAQAIAVARAVRHALSSRYAGASPSSPATPAQNGPTNISTSDHTRSVPFVELPTGQHPISNMRYPEPAGARPRPD